LKDELLEDPSMFVTTAGFVGYADTLEGAPAAELAAPLDAAALPANVFALASRPSSSRVLYLDFDGHVANDPAWGSVGYGGTIVSAPYDLDGSPNSFSAGERARIFEAWQRVAEDYRPFDVNVTTRDPGVENLRRTSVFDTSYGQRMVITPSNFTTAGVIGMALLEVFDADSDHAAYVFADLPVKTDGEDDRRSGLARGRPHVRAEPRRRHQQPQLLRRPWVVGADHGAATRAGQAGHAVVARRVRGRQQLRR
jgi:hypothetical protein